MFKVLKFTSFNIDSTDGQFKTRHSFEMSIDASSQGDLHSFIESHLQAQPILLYDNGGACNDVLMNEWNSICIDARAYNDGLK